VVYRKGIFGVDVVPASCTVEWVAAFGCHIPIFTVTASKEVCGVVAGAQCRREVCEDSMGRSAGMGK